MKQIASNYTYSPTTNVVTLTGVNIDADQLLLIVAPGVGRTMYNFASGVTGAVSAGSDTRVTLNASTVGLTTTSPLVIYYDDQASAQAVTGTVALDPASLVALENVTVTIGSSVTVGGTVTANLFGEAVGGGPSEPTKLQCDSNGFLITSLYRSGSDAVNYDPVAGNVSVNVKNVSSITIGSLPAISGTVTVGGLSGNAVTTGYTFNGTAVSSLPVIVMENALGNIGTVDVSSGSINVTNSVTIGSLPAISGTVTANLALVNFYDVLTNYSANYTEPFPVFIDQGGSPLNATVTIGNSVTIGSVPNGSLTTRFGTPTTANVSFATAAVTKSDRKYLLIQNVTTGSNVITVGIGFTPTTTQGIQLTAGAGITFESSYIPTGAVYVLSSVTASNFTILEA